MLYKYVQDKETHGAQWASVSYRWTRVAVGHHQPQYAYRFHPPLCKIRHPYPGLPRSLCFPFAFRYIPLPDWRCNHSSVLLCLNRDCAYFRRYYLSGTFRNHIRFFPRNKFSGNVTICAGDDFVCINLIGATQSVIVESKEFASTFRQIFELVWESNLTLSLEEVMKQSKKE